MPAFKYLSDIVEQVRRAIKRKSSAMHVLKAFERATVMISGLELAQRIQPKLLTEELGVGLRGLR